MSGASGSSKLMLANHNIHTILTLPKRNRVINFKNDFRKVYLLLATILHAQTFYIHDTISQENYFPSTYTQLKNARPIKNYGLMPGEGKGPAGLFMWADSQTVLGSRSNVAEGVLKTTLKTCSSFAGIFAEDMFRFCSNLFGKVCIPASVA